MENLSVIEQKLYDYIKEKGEVTFDTIKKDLGDKYLGAAGKLMRKELVEKGKRRTGEANKYGFGVILEKIIKIKEAK